MFFHCTKEKVDISTVNICKSEQHTPKQSRKINSTTSQREKRGKFVSIVEEKE